MEKELKELIKSAKDFKEYQSIGNGAKLNVAIENAEQALSLVAIAGRSEQYLCKHCNNKKALHSETSGLCPDRFKHFEAK